MNFALTMANVHTYLCSKSFRNEDNCHGKRKELLAFRKGNVFKNHKYRNVLNRQSKCAIVTPHR